MEYQIKLFEKYGPKVYIIYINNFENRNLNKSVIKGKMGMNTHGASSGILLKLNETRLRFHAVKIN